MSKIFYTSDWHLGHSFVARLRGFDSVEEHDAVLEENLFSTLTKQDQLINVGDTAIGSFERVISLAARLPCNVHLVAGNHDPVHPMHRNAHIEQRRFMRGFASVNTLMRRKIAGREVLISHLPYFGDHRSTGERHTQYRLRDEGVPLICGHVHGDWKTSAHQFNVGVDVWDLAPVEEAEVRSWLSSLHSIRS